MSSLLAPRACRSRSSLVGAIATVALGQTACAGTTEPARAPVTPRIELRHDTPIDGAVTGGLAAAYGAVLLVRNDLQPRGCRWCDGSSPADVNAVDAWFRDRLRRPDPRPARLVSDVLSFGVAPLGIGTLLLVAAAADRRGDDVLTDLLLSVQGALSAVVAIETLKPIFARPRPSLHAQPREEAEAAAASDPESLRSFPSGHAGAIVAMAASSGMIASMRGYRLAPLVWTSGILFGLTAAYGRIAADEHYFTDTLAGAALGLAFGAGVHLLFHRPRGRPASGLAGFLGRSQLTTTTLGGARIVGLAWAL